MAGDVDFIDRERTGDAGMVSLADNADNWARLRGLYSFNDEQLRLCDPPRCSTFSRHMMCAMVFVTETQG